MQEWQAKFARSLIFYAIALFGMAGLSLTPLWIFHDDTLTRFHRDPVMTVFSIGASIFAAVACLGAGMFCFDIRRETLRHDQKMKQIEAERLRQLQNTMR